MGVDDTAVSTRILELGRQQSSLEENRWLVVMPAKLKIIRSRECVSQSIGRTNLV
jgi:hypothetical protein